MNAPHCCRSLLLLVAWASITVVLTATSLLAQTPTPNFTLTRNPQLWHNTWPADFNGDSRVDLVAGTRGASGDGPAADLVVALGNGEGTFQPARSLGVAAKPLGVGDFNGDGRTDVVVTYRPSGATSDRIAVIPGNGNGTFGAARDVDTQPSTYAVVADFNGDGKRDVAVNGVSASGDGAVLIYPGNGDFTFGPEMTLPVIGSASAISGDFNGDGRRDLAVVQECCSLFIFTNEGGLLFTSQEIVMSQSLADITTGDLNGDSKADLIIAAYPLSQSDFIPGTIEVLLGNGDGTFRDKQTYDTGLKGEVTIVAGDFNRDGKVDIATGNWSRYYDDDTGAQLWDSIAVMTGDGTGALHFGRAMALGFVNKGDLAYHLTHNSLNTADLNGDRQMDLIGSPGAILLNRPEAPNRPPTVFAGADETHYDSSVSFYLRGQASDPDGDWLDYRWDGGPSTGPDAFRWPGPGVYTYTLCVDDRRGGTACDSVTITVAPSDGSVPFVGLTRPAAGEDVVFGRLYTIKWSASADRGITRFDLFSSGNDGRSFTRITECTALPATARECTWREPAPLSQTARVRIVAFDTTGRQWIDVSERFRIVTTPTALPSGWFNRDVGLVGAAGSATFDGSTFTVEGSGADIWGAADEFHWTFTLTSGNVEITALVNSVQNVNQWTKAGVMMRTHPGAGAQHASLFVTPTIAKGLAFQRRPMENGASVHTAGPAITAPVWVKLSRHGNVVSAYYRKSIVHEWTLIGRQVFADLAFGLQVGLAVTSHVDGTLATAAFSNVAINEVPNWFAQDIGSVGVPGRVNHDFVVSTVEGSGADIWGTADAFHFQYTRWNGDGTLTARVRSIENTNAWAKAGVMFRETLTPGSKHVMAVVTPAKGVAMQYRAATGGMSANAGLRAGTAPEWLRLTRAGNTFSGFSSNDGVTWTSLGSVTVDIGTDIFVGFPVTSHNNTTLATAVFEDITVTQ